MIVYILHENINRIMLIFKEETRCGKYLLKNEKQHEKHDRIEKYSKHTAMINRNFVNKRKILF